MMQQHDAPGASAPAEEVLSAPNIAVPASGDPPLIALAEVHFSDHHVDFAEAHNSYVRSMIALADTKGAWAFAVGSGVATYILGLDSVRLILTHPAWSADFLLVSTGVVLLLLSTGSAFLVIAPRLSSPSGEGVIFFAAVAQRATARDYARDVAKMSASELTDAKLKHSYDIARVCTRKYDFLRRAIWLGIAGLIDALLIALWIAR